MIFISQINYFQSIFGKWKTIDDVTGKEKAIVEIFEIKGKVYAKIIDILNPEKKHHKCEKCENEDKNKPILGLTIIKGLKKNDDIYDGGTILDPNTGKIYRCKVSLNEKDKLVVRGFIGISLLGRSQTWIRVKS